MWQRQRTSPPSTAGNVRFSGSLPAHQHRGLQSLGLLRAGAERNSQGSTWVSERQRFDVGGIDWTKIDFHEDLTLQCVTKQLSRSVAAATDIVMTHAHVHAQREEAVQTSCGSLTGKSFNIVSGACFPLQESSRTTAAVCFITVRSEHAQGNLALLHSARRVNMRMLQWL